MKGFEIVIVDTLAKCRELKATPTNPPTGTLR